jgi:hypothetical protein
MENPAVFLQDSIFVPPQSCTSHSNPFVIIVASLASVVLIVFLILLICLIHRKQKASQPRAINDLYGHMEEPLDSDAIEIGQSRCSTTIVRNVIFRGHCIGAPAEDSEVPMIVEPNDEYANFVSYENVAASRGGQRKKKKRGKNPTSVVREVESTQPIIARPQMLESNVTQWSYLPQDA